MHWNMSFGTLFVFFALELYTIYYLEKCLHAFSALSYNMTLNEFSHTDSYAYLFNRVRVKKNFDESKIKNDYNQVSFARSVLNPFSFFFDCSRKSLIPRRETLAQPIQTMVAPARGGATRYSLLSKDPVATRQTTEDDHQSNESGAFSI